MMDNSNNTVTETMKSGKDLEYVFRNSSKSATSGPGEDNQVEPHERLYELGKEKLKRFEAKLKENPGKLMRLFLIWR